MSRPSLAAAQALIEACPVLVSRLETPFGFFYLASRGDRLIASAGPDPARAAPLAWGALRWPAAAVEPAGNAHREARAQLRAYFAGRLRRFELVGHLPWSLP